jgi:penicillin amidase
MVRRSTPVLLALILAAACGDNIESGAPRGPYDDVDLSRTLEIPGLSEPVHVVRDEHGIAHISASNLRDLGIAQGYVMALDRLPQMDILRRFGAGTLSEIFGALDDSVVESDLEMRVHRMQPIAAEALAELRASGDPRDAEILELIDGFAIGVNAYAAELAAGVYELDSAVRVSFDPDRFEAWTAVDSLVLGRFQAHSLSFSANDEVDFTRVYQGALAHFDEAPGPGPDFDAARDARRGAASDLARLIPAGRRVTADGFPNVESDGGTRSNDVQLATPTLAPRVPRALLDQARRFFAPKIDGLGPHSFRRPQAGSNGWVVGPELAGGKALIAGDQHLPLPNPSIFYPTHLVIPGRLDVEGVTFPGIPGVILGHNGKMAWTSTVVAHDVNDVYLEDIVPCSSGGGDCVLFDGGEVAIETRTETIEIGALGTIVNEIEAVYEEVPHHGYIIPEIGDRELVGRTGDQALSVRYTGNQVTHEIRAIFGLTVSSNVDEAFEALGHFGFGGQNWVVISDAGDIAWTTHALIPRRSPEAMTWDPESNKRGTAPWMVLPGDGSAEWDGFVDSRYIPHAINPGAGFIATANSDPVGVTLDGDPLNGPMVDGRPLYVGALYAAGLRTERIVERIEAAAAAGPIDLDELASIQNDTRSTVGARTRDALVVALGALDGGGPNDAVDFVAGLSGVRLAELQALRALLADWSLATPPDASGDGAATTLFNVWMHFFLGEALGDEMAAIGENIHSLNANFSVRAAIALFEEPNSFASGLDGGTGEPVLCDDLGTAETESCTGAALRALDAALTHLASGDGFGSSDPADWSWGRLHTLTMEPLFPATALEVPSPDDPDPTWRDGFPAPGDQFVVNASNGGYNDLAFSFGGGPAQRFLAEVDPGGVIRVRLALPGGVTYDRSSPHYRDLFDRYYSAGSYFDLPFATAEIVAAAEERWLLLP